MARITHTTFTTIGEETRASYTFDTLPVGIMDNATKARLEEIRLCTPRYLFRAWNTNSSGPFYRGRKDLNTVDAIIPAAFRQGQGHSSVYDLTRVELVSMVEKHVSGYSEPYFTEFSYWTPSLSYAVAHAIRVLGGDSYDCRISIIDTKNLRAQNQIFAVRDLSFLRLPLQDCAFHYLAHGVIRGPFLRSLPIGRFWAHDFDQRRIASLNESWARLHARQITERAVRLAWNVGVQYGDNFALPVALALICVDKRHIKLFAQGDNELQIVLEGVSGLQFPRDWMNDSTITRDVVYTDMGTEEPSYDTDQFIRLMRAVLRSRDKTASAQITDEGTAVIGTGHMSIAHSVRFDDARNEVRLFDKDESIAGDCSPGRSKRTSEGTVKTQKRRADSDDEMEDDELGSGELKRTFKKLRLGREVDGLRRWMHDGGKAKISGHHGFNADAGVHKRLRSQEQREPGTR